MSELQVKVMNKIIELMKFCYWAMRLAMFLVFSNLAVVVTLKTSLAPFWVH